MSRGKMEHRLDDLVNDALIQQSTLAKIESTLVKHLTTMKEETTAMLHCLKCRENNERRIRKKD